MSEHDGDDGGGPDETPEDDPPDDVEPLLHFLRDRRGFDFTGYKRPSLTRRIRRRMGTLGMATYADYIRLLESQPGEFGQLFDTILINVTSFRRDPEAWDGLAQEVLPAIAERSDASGSEIRIWSAGCASGQEAYTLAVLMADIVGVDRFKTGVKIYATDVDEDALRTARMGRYPYSQLVEAFGEERTARYFEPADTAYSFRSDLRRSVIFGRHDLVQDPPISRIDLIACRNTLMYFNAEIQHRIVASFHFALLETGYLFLGKAEAFATRVNLFSAVDMRHHIFAKRAGARNRPPLPAPVLRHAGGSGSTDHRALIGAAFDGGPSAQMAVDRDGVLVAANRLARSLFGLGANHLGRPLRDLEVSYRPIELRSIIDEVLARRRAVTLPHIAFRPPHGSTETFEVVVQPVEEAGTILGITITFVDVSRYKVLQEELEQSHRELEVAHEELQSAMEELETTNEELQSTNEELETTNEELHSTNEELETMNEELQSTNDEVASVNIELRRSSDEARGANSFMESILGSLHAGVAVLGPDLTVRVWNGQSEELWGLRADEVQGLHFLALDIGLPVDHLKNDIREVSRSDRKGGPQRRRLQAVNRRGRTIDVEVTITPLGGKDEPDGVILLMEELESGNSAGS